MSFTSEFGDDKSQGINDGERGRIIDLICYFIITRFEKYERGFTSPKNYLNINRSETYIDRTKVK